ncbi:DUF4905 domain-containing protein [Cytophagaceae bacterium ABcell3]|nr:DUF4905 domain-containing protein [Cytophagaceae bacterium ABcell3]
MLNLKSIFKKENPVQISLGGQLWKVIENEGFLYCEIRYAKERRVSFCCVEIAKGKVVWENPQLPDDDWWMGMDMVVRDRLLLYTYEDPDRPEPKGVFALNVLSGKLVWGKKDYFCTAYSNGILYVQNSEGETLVVDPETGAEQLSGGKERQVEELIQDHLKFPDRYNEGETHYDTVVSYIKDLLEAEPVLAVDYIEHNSNIIVSSHAKSENRLYLYLLIMDMEGKVKHKQLLETSLKGLSADTFFIYSNALIYISERTKLNLYYF